MYRSSLRVFDVHVWLADLTGLAARRADLYSLLSVDEREGAKRYRTRQARETFELTRGLLRMLLARYLDLNPPDILFTRSSAGKPRLEAETDLTFSVAHCEGMALLAVARGRAVGVDIERIDRPVNVEALRPMLCSDPIDGAVESYVRAWTHMEAQVKARGEAVSLTGQTPRECWPVKDLELLFPYVASLCASGDGWSYQLGELPEDWLSTSRLRRSSSIPVPVPAALPAPPFVPPKLRSIAK
jgi:4'-phosphopantetheinyl transferase